MCNVIQRAVISVFSLDFFFLFSYRFILVCNLLAMGKALVRCCSAPKIWTVFLKLWRRKKCIFRIKVKVKSQKWTQIAIEPKMERMFLLPAGFAGCSPPSLSELVGKDVWFNFQEFIYLFTARSVRKLCRTQQARPILSSLSWLPTFVLFCYFYICIFFKHIKTFFCISLIFFCDYYL